MASEARDRSVGTIPPLAGESAPGEVSPRLTTRYKLAGLAITAERLLPELLPAVGTIAVFLILSWIGAFEALEPGWRMALTLGFGAAFAYFCLPLTRLRFPARAEIERRLDRTSRDFPRPLATLADAPAGTPDAFTAALWEVHRRRAEKASAALNASSADPRLRDKDRYALRAGVLLALIASAFVAGDQRAPRIAQAFDWSTPRVPPAPPRLDAWIDPPAYTGRPPIFLSGTAGTPSDEVIRAPVGATLTVRSTTPRVEGKEPAAAKIELSDAAGLEAPKTDPAAPVERKQAGVALERRIIRADSAVKVLRDGREVAQYRFAVIPDLAPKVTLKEVKAESASPERQTPGGIRASYLLEDDYGIAKAELIIERAADKPGAKPTRTLFPPPAASIPLRLGAGEAALPTEDHPWAGEEVRVRLRVEDDLGQVSESETKTVVLPQRPFSQPLAKALVEQRRTLNFSPDDTANVRLAFDGLLFEPERFTPKVGDFLALDMIRAGLRTARTDERLKDIAEQIHELALYLENGDMTDAEKRLREAEARLREALERDASPEEVKRLAEELRRAMEQFLREFAERALRNQDNAQDRSPIDTGRMLTQRDLADMLRKIEEMARSGNMAEAQRLLNELKQILENLRSARRQDVDPRMRELGQQIEELDRLQREQRDLRDRTFREGQQRGQNQQGQRGQQQQRGQQRGQQPGQNGEQSLQDQQQALRDRLKQLRDRLQQRGMQEGEGFGDADQGMGDAGEQLGQGKPGDATGGQQRALDGLGKAAEGMAQELQRQLGQGDDPGEGEGEGPGMGQPGPSQRGRAENRMDPLGRPQSKGRRDGEDTSKIDGFDESENRNPTKGTIGERADSVLRELRRRLGEFERPRDELDYLERLLRQR